MIPLVPIKTQIPANTMKFKNSLFALAGSSLFATSSAFAADGIWNGISGNWTDTTDPGGVWSGGTIATGADATAFFTGIDIAADRSISLNGTNRTIGNITFTDATTPSNNLAITGNTLTLDRTSGVPVIDVTQAGRTLSISSVVAGNDGLQKDGAGNLTLSAQNTFSGPLNVNGGTLEFSNNDNATRNVFQSTQININNGATLRVSGALGNIELYNGRAFTFDSGGGGSILVGTGNYNANTAGFSITTNGGARNNIGLISTSGAFGLNLGNQLGTFNVALGSDATSDLTVTPIIANTGSILKSGNGRLTFTASNTYSGTTTISAGTLIANSSAALGNASATNTLIFTGGTLQAGASFNSGATRTVTLTSTGIINTNGNTVGIAGIISGAGGLTKNGGGDLNLTGANTYNGTTTVNAGRITITAATHLSSGATSIAQSGTGQIFINAGVTISNPFNISTTGYLEPSDSQNNINGAIRLNGSTLSGQVTLSGNSRIGAFASTTNTISGKITGGFGIDFYGFNNLANQAPIFIISNTNNDYTGTTTIYNSNFNTTNLTNVSTTLRLGASNVIPDGASAGNVAFAINGTNNNATVILDLNGFSETINGLTVNAGTFATRITNTAAATSASVLTIGANNTSSSFSGTITDSGASRTLAITKIGNGTLTLSGSSNNYSGATTVNAGALLINGTHITATAGSGYTVNNADTTLGGTGRLAINGSVSVASTAILAPGASIGTLTLDGVNTTGNVLTMTTGSKFSFELDAAGGTPDRLDFWNYLAGDLALNTNAIDLSLLGTQTAGTYSVDIFRFFSNGGSTAATHAFSSGLAIGALGTGISSASIDWDGTGNNNQTIALTYTVIPEPSAALLGGLGLLPLLRHRRNR